MARQYRRDARGRFASGGYSGQTAGRGARLMAKNTRAGGGAKIQAGKVGGTLRKPKGLKPDPQAKKRGVHGSLNREGVLGKVAQKRGLQKAAQGAMQRLGIKDRPSTQRRMARPSGILSKRVGGMKVSGSVTRNDHARVTRGLGRAERKAAPVAAVLTAAQFSSASTRAKQKTLRVRNRVSARLAQANTQDAYAIKQARNRKTTSSRKKANKAFKSAQTMLSAARIVSGSGAPRALRPPATRLY